jgi:hypothetical protein
MTEAAVKGKSMMKNGQSVKSWLRSLRAKRYKKKQLIFMDENFSFSLSFVDLSLRCIIKFPLFLLLQQTDG